MPVEFSRVELPESSAVMFDQGAERWAIVLPGAGYSTQAPLLWYARAAAIAAGRNALVLTDSFDRERHAPRSWVETQVRATFEHVRRHDAHPLVIAKSITSLAAGFAARERLPAVWLTPLIGASATSAAGDVLAGLHAAVEPALLIGGTADPTWDGPIAAAIPNAEILELPDADHGLEVAGDVAGSLSNLVTVTDAITRFIVDRLK